MVITIAKMLPTAEYECKFVIVGKNKGDIVRFIPEQYTVDLIKIPNIWCFGFTKILLYIKSDKPDIVYSSQMYLNSRVTFAGHLAGCRQRLRGGWLL